MATLINITHETREEIFDKAYNGSYYTIEGAAGEPNEWAENISALLHQQGIGTPKEFISFRGEDMNDHYNLTGTNAYQDDLSFIGFSIDGLNIERLAIFKLRMGDRWFNDIVDNNERREMEKYN